MKILKANEERYRIHLASTQLAARLQQIKDLEAQKKMSTSTTSSDIPTTASILSKYGAPFAMRYVRRLPIVGDVHLRREEWPSAPKDWLKLWMLPHPIRVCKIRYAINVEA